MGMRNAIRLFNEVIRQGEGSSLMNSGINTISIPANLANQDVTEIIGNEISGGGAHYIEPGTYRIKDLDVPSETTLWCDNKAIFRSASPTNNDNLISWSSGGKFLIHIYGGRWIKCSNVINHTADSAISNSTFDHMRVKGAFRFRASVGNRLKECRITDTKNGIVFSGKQCNANRIINCSWSNISNSCVELLGDNSTINNTFLGGWIENCIGNGFVISGKTQQVTITDFYFEDVGDDVNETYAILADSTLTPGNPKQIVVSKSRFGNSSGYPSSAFIRRRGHVGLQTYNNKITVAEGKSFILASGTNEQHIRCSQDFLNYSGSGNPPYSDVCVKVTGGAVIPIIEPYFGSIGVEI